MYELDGILFLHGKIVVPKSLRIDMLQRIHESHLGKAKCLALARQIVMVA